MIRGFLLVAAVVSLSINASTANAQQVTLTGAGSTFAYPLYSSWSNEYHKLHPNVQVNYQSIGSGGGVRQVITGTVDFGGSDFPMNDQQLSDARSQRKTDVLNFPVALGADVPTYNVPGVTAELNFTQAALAGIFLGKITKWNDPEIQKANPSVKLPGNDIVVVHRSDGSGTTFVWVDYLAKISPEWKTKVGVGSSVNWPVGLGGKGNEGVAGLVKQTANSLGYVELIYAIQTNMSYGKVRNQSGAFVKAELSSVTAAAAGAVKNMPADYRVSITDAPGKDSYPVSSFTWMLVPKTMQDKSKGQALKAFLIWGLTDGQKLLAPLAYSNVAPSVVAKEMQTIKELQY